MVKTLKAEEIALAQLSETFGLERTDDEQFFREWQDDLPELADLEKQALNEVKGDYLHLSKYPLLEPLVKMVVLSPLLRLAGFYRPPFYVAAEKAVRITSEDNGTVVTGRLDLLVFHPNFWILVIEAERAEYSLEAGIPQALAYMLGNPDSEKPAFGFVTNGSEFRFLKLHKQAAPRYALSDLFSIDSRNDLFAVLQVLKRLGRLLAQ